MHCCCCCYGFHREAGISTNASIDDGCFIICRDLTERQQQQQEGGGAGAGLPQLLLQERRSGIVVSRYVFFSPLLQLYNPNSVARRTLSSLFFSSLI
jgi:hypothetical protein